jgi:hypothetical protein
MSKKPRTGYNPLVENYLPQIKDSRENKPVIDEVVDDEEKTIAKTQSKTVSQSQTFSDSQTFAKTAAAAGIKDKVAQGSTKPRRLEDSRKRQTYWMEPEEIKMIVEISKRAGVSKYQVVSAAVRLLYDYVFEGEPKKA